MTEHSRSFQIHHHTRPFLTQLALTSSACLACAERSAESGITCAKQCKECYELCQLCSRLLAMNAESTLLRQVVSILLGLLDRCAQHCSSHCCSSTVSTGGDTKSVAEEREHCKECSMQCSELARLLRESFEPMAVRITSVIGM